MSISVDDYFPTSQNSSVRPTFITLWLNFQWNSGAIRLASHTLSILNCSLACPVENEPFCINFQVLSLHVASLFWVRKQTASVLTSYNNLKTLLLILVWNRALQKQTANVNTSWLQTVSVRTTPTDWLLGTGSWAVNYLPAGFLGTIKFPILVPQQLDGWRKGQLGACVKAAWSSELPGSICTFSSASASLSSHSNGNWVWKIFFRLVLRGCMLLAVYPHALARLQLSFQR